MGAVLSAKLGSEAGAALLTSCLEGDSVAAGQAGPAAAATLCSSHLASADWWPVQLLKSNQRLAVWTSWADGSSPLHAAVGAFASASLAKSCLLPALTSQMRTVQVKGTLTLSETSCSQLVHTWTARASPRRQCSSTSGALSARLHWRWHAS